MKTFNQIVDEVVKEKDLAGYADLPLVPKEVSTEIAKRYAEQALDEAYKLALVKHVSDKGSYSASVIVMPDNSKYEIDKQSILSIKTKLK
jgi:hypothetical protein